MATILTYDNIRDRVLRTLDEGGAAATDTTYLVAQDMIQSAHTSRCTEHDWPFMLWPRAQTFSTVSGTRVYGLHQEMRKLLYIWNRNQNVFLTEVPYRQLESSGSDWVNDTGLADRFVIHTRQPVSAQPTTNTTLRIVSSSTSDVTGPTVIIRGETSNGVTTETLTANGTTAVTSTNTFLANGILNITKTGTWVGNMTLSDGTTTFLVLFPTELGRSYQQLELLRGPTTVETLEYRFYRQPSPLSNDNDLPDLPPPYGELIIWDAILLMGVYVTSISQKVLDLASTRQKDLETRLYQDYLEGQTLGAQPTFVRDLSDAAFVPRYVIS